MPEGDGDEMLCQFKERNAAPGKILAKVSTNSIVETKMQKHLRHS